ncbi:MAG: LysM peptidoglycan-binding domain-containing protein [Anaerolineales bacterium]
MFTKFMSIWIALGRRISLLRVSIIGALALGVFALPVSPAYAAECQLYHTVLPGETLYRIGLKYNFTWDKIAAANGITNSNRVLAGQKLCIPKPAGSTTPGGQPAPDAVIVLGTNVQRVLLLTDVNVRVGPGMQYKAIDKAVTGQTVRVTGISSDLNWWRVDCPQGSGVKDCFITAGQQYTQPVANTTPAPQPQPSGIPIITINAVVRDQTVTISARNFPAGQSFNVRMGAYGTQALGGVHVGSTNTGNGTFTATYNVPANLRGSTRIAIRLEGSGGYYSYNWFWNNTAN